MLLNDNSNFLRYKTHKRQFHLKNSPDYSLRSTNTSPINMICIAHRKNCNITTDLKTTKAKNLENPGRNSSIWQNCAYQKHATITPRDGNTNTPTKGFYQQLTASVN